MWQNVSHPYNSLPAYLSTLCQLGHPWLSFDHSEKWLSSSAVLARIQELGLAIRGF